MRSGTGEEAWGNMEHSRDGLRCTTCCVVGHLRFLGPIIAYGKRPATNFNFLFPLCMQFSQSPVPVAGTVRQDSALFWGWFS